MKAHPGPNSDCIPATVFFKSPRGSASKGRDPSPVKTSQMNRALLFSTSPNGRTW